MLKTGERDSLSFGIGFAFLAHDDLTDLSVKPRRDGDVLDTHVSRGRKLSSVQIYDKGRSRVIVGTVETCSWAKRSATPLCSYNSRPCWCDIVSLTQLQLEPGDQHLIQSKGKYGRRGGTRLIFAG